MFAGFGRALFGLFQILALALAQLAGVLDGLFGARDLGADLVVAALDCVEGFRLFGEIFARGFDRRLDGAQLGDQRLHRRVALAQDGFLRLRIALDGLQAQGDQFGVELALVLLQGLVAARGRGLTLQVAQLLLDFLADVVQALQVLLGGGDAIRGLAATLLVLGNAGRLFDEAAQLLGTRLDDAARSCLAR